MIYDYLAKLYDALVQDDEATLQWCDFICKHMPKGKVLELACGSGEIAIALSKQGYNIVASDISLAMINVAKEKQGSNKIKWQIIDMRDFRFERQFDGITCLCDSFNYLRNENEVLMMFRCVYDALREDGVFIFDMHSQDRLAEFKEEYIETGKVCNQEFQWSILSEEDYIYQTFLVYDHQQIAHSEQHVQRVFDSEMIAKHLHNCGFDVKIYTDFINEGICPGEKIFYVAKKVKK